MKGCASNYSWIIKKTHVDPWVYPDIFWELKALSDKTFEIQRRMLKSKQRRIWNLSKGGFEIQVKVDLKSKQRRIWNPSKEEFEIQIKKDFDIHAKKYPLGHATNRDFNVQFFWIYE